MTVHRRWHAVARNVAARWDARCGTPSIDRREYVEVTGRWANGEAIHGPHRVRVSGARMRGCVHARPRLAWFYRIETQDWVTYCALPDCPGGPDDDVA